MSDNKYLEQMINSVKNIDSICHFYVNDYFIVSLKELLKDLSELNYDFGSKKISYKNFIYIWEQKKEVRGHKTLPTAILFDAIEKIIFCEPFSKGYKIFNCDPLWIFENLNLFSSFRELIITIIEYIKTTYNAYRHLYNETIELYENHMKLDEMYKQFAGNVKKRKNLIDTVQDDNMKKIKNLKEMQIKHFEYIYYYVKLLKKYEKFLSFLNKKTNYYKKMIRNLRYLPPIIIYHNHIDKYLTDYILKYMYTSK